MRGASDIAGTASAPTHCAIGANALRLAASLRADDIDAAIESGLMAFSPCADCARDPAVADAIDAIAHAQTRLRAAWAARDRYRAREARIARRERERTERRRAGAVAAPQGPAAPRPPLPAAVASVRARATAKAAGQ
jgi:hypothetical protein